VISIYKIARTRGGCASGGRGGSRGVRIGSQSLVQRPGLEEEGHEQPPEEKEWGYEFGYLVNQVGCCLTNMIKTRDGSTSRGRGDSRGDRMGQGDPHDGCRVSEGLVMRTFLQEMLVPPPDVRQAIAQAVSRAFGGEMSERSCDRVESGQPQVGYVGDRPGGNTGVD
jgi:hypothetical protein